MQNITISPLSFYVNCYFVLFFFSRNKRIDFQPSLASIAFHFFYSFISFVVCVCVCYFPSVQSLLVLYQCSVCFFFFNYFERSRISRCFYFQCILVVFAIIAVSNAIPIELGHYASPIYAPVAKAIVPEPIVSVVLN